MTWAKVQSFEAHNFTGSAIASLPVTLASPVAVGDTVVVETTVSTNPTTLASSTLQDQLGNVWTRLTVAQGGQLYDAGGNQGVDYWWCIIAHAGTPTITYAPGSAQPFLNIMGDHFTGSDAASTRRDSKAQAQTNPGTAANAIASPSVAAQSADLLWGSSGDPTNASATEAIGTGFSAGRAIDATTGFLTEWETATGAGAATFTDATNGGARNYFTAGIAITPAAGGGTTGPNGDRYLLEAAAGVLLLEAAAGALLLEALTGSGLGTTPMQKLVATAAVAISAAMGGTTPMQTFAGQVSVATSAAAASITPMQKFAGQAAVATSGTMSATTPMQTLSGVGVVPIAGTHSPVTPMQLFQASAANPITGTFGASTPMQRLAAQATVGAVTTTGAFAASTPMQQFGGAATVAITGSFRGTMPMQTLTMSGTALFPAPPVVDLPLGATRVVFDPSRTTVRLDASRTLVTLDPSRTRIT